MSGRKVPETDIRRSRQIHKSEHMRRVPDLWLSTLVVLLLLGSKHSVADQLENYEVANGVVLSGVKRFDGTLPSQALSILGLRLDQSTFSEVRSVLGPSRELSHKYDLHAANEICYYPKERQDFRLSFLSGWPENPSDRLTMFSITARATDLKAPCAHTEKLPENVTTDNGLGLGLSQSELIAKLGPPSRITSDWLIYAFQKYRKYLPAESARQPEAPGGGQYKGEYLYHDLRAHFSHGKLDKIEVQVGGEADW